MAAVIRAAASGTRLRPIDLLIRPDIAPVLPEPRSSGADTERGRGLAIIAALQPPAAHHPPRRQDPPDSPSPPHQPSPDPPGTPNSKPKPAHDTTQQPAR
jgi:hypothetical protein